MLVRRLVLPLRPHCEVCLPRAFQRHSRNVLFRCFESAAGDDDVRLQLPRQFAQAARRAVKEDHIDGSILREHLANLRLVVFEETRIIFRRYGRCAALDGNTVLMKPMEIVR